MKPEPDIIAMARAAKSFHAAAAVEDDSAPPSDESFIRAAVAFSMLARMGDIVKEMAVIVPNLDGMNRDHAIVTIALNFSDTTPSTKERAGLFATVLPDDYGEALSEAVAANRRVLGLPPQALGSKPASKVERLDYSKPPEGYEVSHWSKSGTADACGWYFYEDPSENATNGGDPKGSYGEALEVAWVHYKASDDPSGCEVFGCGSMAGGRVVRGWKFRFGIESNEVLYPDRAQARAAAWAWYDHRLALHWKFEDELTQVRLIDHHPEVPTSVLCAGLWPRCLTWSDEQVAEVERWLVDSTVEMPKVLR
mgnify:CR=1 FL=1